MFPPAVRDFIRNSIRSIWAVEVLLVLCRDDRRVWTIAALTRELRSSELAVTGSLERFSRAGLIRYEEDGVRYAPASPHLDDVVRQLQAAYAAHPLAVSTEIFATEVSKVQSLADAFKLKKD